jgi:putative membrane protein insertion efficiency factor
MTSAIRIVLLLLPQLTRACSVCCHIAAFGPSILSAPRRQSLTFVELLPFQERRQAVVRGPLGAMARPVLKNRFLFDDDQDSNVPDRKEDEPPPSSNDNPPKSTEPMSAAMIASIGVYKNFISPLLPPACRFLPTCSQYGVQAIEEFGPCQGSILTAWRLLRCSPIGGKGYDPPKWPPVSYWYSSY